MSDNEHLEEMAAQYVADGSVTDFAMGMRKARAITQAAEIYLDAAMRIETERVLAQAQNRVIREEGDNDARRHQWSEEPYLSPEQVCELVPGMTVANLKDLRASGKGPAYFKPTGERGKVTVYSRADVVAWVQRSRVSTRDQE